jgi:hypothetical protein
MVFNISNRYLNLRPLLFAYAEKAGLQALYLADKDRESIGPGYTPSEYVLIADASVFEALPEAVRNRFQDATDIQGRLLWTDEFSNLLSVLK